MSEHTLDMVFSMFNRRAHKSSTLCASPHTRQVALFGEAVVASDSFDPVDSAGHLRRHGVDARWYQGKSTVGWADFLGCLRQVGIEFGTPEANCVLSLCSKEPGSGLVMVGKLLAKLEMADRHRPGSPCSMSPAPSSPRVAAPSSPRVAAPSSPRVAAPSSPGIAPVDTSASMHRTEANNTTQLQHDLEHDLESMIQSVQKMKFKINPDSSPEPSLDPTDMTLSEPGRQALSSSAATSSQFPESLAVRSSISDSSPPPVFGWVPPETPPEQVNPAEFGAAPISGSPGLGWNPPRYKKHLEESALSKIGNLPQPVSPEPVNRSSRVSYQFL
eukprot:TRINITY_DN5644_c0_g1_i1.p1 TRINITY_DN5644_c0_g1~~TRINITY_DN5644_c0_g1_i1.p1  ORF type:complete len:330 (+),score=38.77 TRINITY_DN5644_c0_g1_i1:243-1232(+)